MPDTVAYEADGTVATLTLNRPERLNTITPDLALDVLEALARANADPAIHAIRLRGAGLGLADHGDVDLSARARAVQAPAAHRGRARRAHRGGVGAGLAGGAGGRPRRGGARARAARRPAALQPAADDEAAGQHGDRADGPAHHPAHRHPARRRGPPHPGGGGLHEARDGGRARGGGRAGRAVRRLRAGAAIVGIVLAGGAATRLGGDKAAALLAGRPLLAWAVDALRGAGLERVAVTAKEGAPLPDLGIEVWREPPEPRHPLAGVRAALERAGAEILTLPVDLPLVPPSAVRALLDAALHGAVAVVACPGGRVQPLVGRFTPAAYDHLPLTGRATDAVLALDPVLVDLPEDGFLNVNAPADLVAAEALVLRRAARGR